MHSNSTDNYLRQPLIHPFSKPRWAKGSSLVVALQGVKSVHHWLFELVMIPISKGDRSPASSSRSLQLFTPTRIPRSEQCIEFGSAPSHLLSTGTSQSFSPLILRILPSYLLRCFAPFQVITIHLDLSLQLLIVREEWIGASPTDPDFSVLLNPNRKGVVPAYFQIAGFDPVRDEGLLFERLLREAGVKTKLDV